MSQPKMASELIIAKLDELLRLDPKERWFLSDAKTSLVNLKASSPQLA